MYFCLVFKGTFSRGWGIGGLCPCVYVYVFSKNMVLLLLYLLSYMCLFGMIDRE